MDTETQSTPPSATMRVAITGSSDLIGTALSRCPANDGHDFVHPELESALRAVLAT